MRRSWRFAGFLVLAVAVAPVFAQNNECDVAGEAPDLIVGDLYGPVSRYGEIGGITAFSVGTYSCNPGTCWANWIAGTNDHPVIAQNMFRLKNGRFEQIGMSWLKHGFTALNNTICGGTCMTTDGTHLGVNCSDPYSASLNGSQTRLGPRFEVNPTTGVFPYPATNQGNTGNAIYKRLQVHNVDLDPTLNVGAQYFVEGHYIAKDEAASKNLHNNASYRTANVTGTPGNFNFTLSGSTVRQKLAIEGWQTVDPTVVLTSIYVENDGRYVLGVKVTDLGGGTWHYDYALHNMNGHRAVGTFTVPIPSWATVTNVGFHDVDYHSGEPIVGTDWAPTVGSSAVTWASETFAQNANANSLRWGSLYNFRFDINSPPTTELVALGMWRSGTPASQTASTLVPHPCNNNGFCEVGENCNNCASDCVGQGGGSGCCGNGTCEPGENPCRCAADCGSQMPQETFCDNGVDEDCDGTTDCVDTNCCIDAACSGFDADGDGYAACDCDDTNFELWATPDEVKDVVIRKDSVEGAVLSWQPPAHPGAVFFTYEAIRSADPADLVAPAACLAFADPAVPECTDASDPALGTAYFYVARAKNACPRGEGDLGVGSDGLPREGRSCP